MTDPSRVTILTQCGDYVSPALARRLASGGTAFVLHAPADGLAEELEAAGADVTVVDDADLTTAAGNQTLVQTALDTYGRVDAACFVTGMIVTGWFTDATDDQWNFVKTVNLDMVFHALQAVLPPMVEQGSGDVVVFTSAAGARPEPKVSLYSSTRAGANALVRAVALEHARNGICVNAVGSNYMDFPGFVAATGADDPERRAQIERQVPARRLGTMEELAEFTAVLLEGKSRFQTGQFFSYSGGWST